MTSGGDSAGWIKRAYDRWLVVPAPDPVASRHAPSILVLSALGAVALLTGEVVRWQANVKGDDLVISCLRLAGAVILAAAFVLIRRGRFDTGVSLFVGGAVSISAVGVAVTGFAANARSLTELTMPLALAALLVGRRALWTSMAAYAAGFTIGELRDRGHLWGMGPHPPAALPFGGVGTAIIGFAVVSIVLDRVGLSLREGFELALARQRELEQKSGDLAQANTALRAEMTKRQAAEAQLIEAQKMEAVSRLSGGIAHDFNNLLTVIIGATQIARDHSSHSPDVLEALDDVRQASERAAELTRQLLAFARRQPVEPKVLSVDERVRAAHKLLTRLLREDIQLDTALDANDWPVRIDPGQLDQVIMNFVVNARDAMPLGGQIAITTRQETLAHERTTASFGITKGDYVVLTVSDQGTGMNEETRARVFEPFYTTKGGTQGSGLGLATCYGIVHQAGGAIFFESELGKGTVFQVYLPRSAQRALDPERSSSGTLNEPKGETILVVEDEVQVRKIEVLTLRRLGYTVLEAASLAQALDVVQTTRVHIDLLLTDLVLPDGHGGEVVEHVRRRYPAIRTLFVSGYTDNPEISRGISDGEFAFLAKPFQAHSLASRVRQVLDEPVAAPRSKS
jgi:signal transduction histidine kinase/CheY-like chemotaxis protein